MSYWLTAKTVSAVTWFRFVTFHLYNNFTEILLSFCQSSSLRSSAPFSNKLIILYLAISQFFMPYIRPESTASRLVLGLTQRPGQWVQRAFFPGLERSRCEADHHWPQSTTEMNIAAIHHSPYVFMALSSNNLAQGELYNISKVCCKYILIRAKFHANIFWRQNINVFFSKVHSFSCLYNCHVCDRYRMNLFNFFL
jgi:hypothetical protein